jgi:MFS transporter, SP family, general alpha glucoside:H+ symporter
MDHFGIPAPDGTKQIPPSWQNGISGATNVGEILGLQVRRRRAELIGTLS